MTGTAGRIALGVVPERSKAVMNWVALALLGAVPPVTADEAVEILPTVTIQVPTVVRVVRGAAEALPPHARTPLSSPGELGGPYGRAVISPYGMAGGAFALGNYGGAAV